LADAGCAVIQVEEPCLHNATGPTGNCRWTIMSMRSMWRCMVCAKRRSVVPTPVGETRCTTLAQGSEPQGGPASHRSLDVDVVTFETAENGCEEIAKSAPPSERTRDCIGVIRHRALQVESPDEVAALIRKALKFVEPERLILSSDCGFGRQGMTAPTPSIRWWQCSRARISFDVSSGLPSAIAATDDRFALA